MAARPKNNLDELQRRHALSPAPGGRATPATPLKSATKSKFKPAKSIATSTPSNVTVRKLPSFSTPGFNNPKPPPLASTSVPAADSSNLSIISISSTDSTSLNASTSSIPAKRLSTGGPDDLIPPLSPKRPKTVHLPDKENIFDVDPHGKGKGRYREQTQTLVQSTTRTVVNGTATTVAVNGRSIPQTGVAALRSGFLTLPHDADLEDKSEEELEGVCNTVQAMIDACDKQVGAAGRGEPRDVPFCDIFNTWLEKRLAAARAILRAIRRGERPSAGNVKSVANVNMQPTFASVPAVSSVFSEQTTSIASSVARQFSPAPPPNVQAVRPSVASNTVEDTDEQYWNSFDDDGVPGVEVFDDPGPSAVLTPATPPATQPRALPPAVAPPSEVPLANPPVNDAQELQKKPYYPEVKDALQRVFKLSSFRTLQLEAICEAMDGRDLFVLFPTGSGKSLTFQLPAVCQDGVTVVVSPLKSLIQDQDRALRKLGVDVMVIMGDMPQQRTLVLQRLGDLKPPKLLYLTPEMLQQSDHMRGALKRLCRIGKLKRFVVDEAHLITDWGRTFRSAYDLRQLRTEFPGVPISALTATANEEVQQDIIKRLDLKICKPLKLSFNRANLDYEVRPRKKNTVKEIADYIHQTHPGDTGIIYCSSRDRCKTLADTLRDEHSLNARDYHAGMPDEERQYIQTLWSTGKVQIIVATIAFGMGIDKPDVRFVIHFNLPSSLKGYYQETGRAGRDGKVAHCILYFTVSEFYSRLEWIRKDSVDKPEEERVWLERQFRDVLGYCMNDVHCRRLQVLNFFGEKFDPRNCRQMCNNCRDPIPITTEDHTQDAQQAIALFEGLAARSKRLTRNQFVSALKGSKTKEMGNKGLTSEALFGCCRHMQQNLVERLVDEMFYEEILSSEQVANGGGYSQAYLLLGREANALKKGRKQLKISFRSGSRKDACPASAGPSRAPTRVAKARGRSFQDGTGYDSPSATGPSASGAPSCPPSARGAPTRAAKAATPIPAPYVLPEEPVKEISLYRDDSDVEFIESEIEEISSPAPSARRMGTRAVPSASQSMAAGYDSEIEEMDEPLPQRVTIIWKEDLAGSVDLGPEMQCRKELAALRDENSMLQDVLDDEAIDFLSAMLPNDAGTLQSTLGDLNIPIEDLQQYSSRVLNICSRYYMLRR